MEDARNRDAAFDFVLIDYSLRGRQWLATSGANQSLRGVRPFDPFMITATGQVVTSSNLTVKGFAGFLGKPVYPGQLKIALQLSRDAKLHGKTIPLITRHMVNQVLHHTNQDAAVATDMFAGLRVLAVDDMKVNLMLIMKLLKKHGCEVMSAENGRQAVEMMKTEHYDIVFMDCQMPEMDGFEATSHIRQQEGETRHTIIVALTADAMTGDREKCLNAGMDDYLNKPLQASKLTEILQKWHGSRNSLTAA